MKKLKDFIYDKNDIIIAALILVAAALIITWRMNVILDYPKQLINNIDSDANATEPADNTEADNTDNSDKQSTDNNQNGSSSDSTNTSQTVELWVDGVLSGDVEVDVTGSTASAAIQCLVDKGLFTDYAEYQTLCDEQGLDHEKVSAGTFTFAKGSTKAQIARKINWS